MRLQGKRILVTGGTGFLGRHIVRALAPRNPAHLFAPGSRDCDLRDVGQVKKMLADLAPHVIVHAAGVVGGIGANRARPAEFFHDNALMGLNLIDQAHRHGVEKAVILGTICAYPKHTPVPMRETDLWNGYPEETNAPYGLSKRMLLTCGQAYRDQYGFNSIHLMPVNLYGPHDNFDDDTSHVIPALVKRCLNARREGAPQITVWGSGRATREFLFVEDAAEGVALATERYDGRDPVNLGGQGEISIAELVRVIAEAVGYDGQIVWDASMPDGQPRRGLDTHLAQEAFGWRPTTLFADGLRRTVAWYTSLEA